ncbi:MAG: aldehyde dehydrogenase family protein, partial [Akkermansia sp.]|nr:aldehyde dehydrogenase family protein [Akkermansia sp.]
MQFVPCLDNQIAKKLMMSPSVGGVVFNGNKAAARQLISQNPTQRVMNSGSGAASVYLAPTADWHKAIRDVLHAVTRRSGQSVLCPHVLFAHAEVYDNQAFINALKDAANSLRAQAGTRENADLGPIGHLLSPADLQALRSQKNGWTWLVQPMAAEMDSRIWSLGVCTGIASAPQFAHRVAGLPLLGVVRVESTDAAIQAQQSVSAGRAAAIYSHDEAEIAHWSRYIDCSSLSINCCPQYRPGLQPCGTWAPALCGAAALQGGPNYITALAQWQETGRPQRRGKQRNIPFSPWDSLSPKPTPDEAMRLTTAADSISYWWENEFGITRTLNPQPGQETTIQYKPAKLCLRVGKATSDIDLSISLMAAL